MTTGHGDLERVLSRAFGRDVALEEAQPGEGSPGATAEEYWPDMAGQGRFEARRFRPNIVVSTGSDDQGFAENDWIGHTVAIGGNVRLAITQPCPRCVMITLPQGDLPKDSGILRTAAQHNAVSVGVYASVLTGGSIRRGDPVTLT